MDYLQNIKSYLQKNEARVKWDQFFLHDESVIHQLVAAADISQDDHVLEVGPGLGFVTRELAARAGQVTAIEIDDSFVPYLADMPANVNIIWGDAYRLLNDKSFQNSCPSPTKTVSSIPYSQAQNMLHNYTNSDWYQGDLVWLTPISFAHKLSETPILSAYFEAEVLARVPSSAFYPQPNTVSAIVELKRIADPIETKRFDIYFRRWLYDHEGTLVKNAIVEGIINGYHDIYQQTITKRQARALLDKLGLPDEHLNCLTSNIRPEYYFSLPAAIQKCKSL